MIFLDINFVEKLMVTIQSSKKSIKNLVHNTWWYLQKKSTVFEKKKFKAPHWPQPCAESGPPPYQPKSNGESERWSDCKAKRASWTLNSTRPSPSWRPNTSLPSWNRFSRRDPGLSGPKGTRFCRVCPTFGSTPCSSATIWGASYRRGDIDIGIAVKSLPRNFNASGSKYWFKTAISLFIRKYQN